ncbi:MAG: hypothetical protein ACRC1T_09485 [Clostridium chrysemydis]|uniref:hypothetical protein n=1 Tax=Clostridium chrysemydis TaxID=2665504 RepID=UPI003F37790C
MNIDKNVNKLIDKCEEILKEIKSNPNYIRIICVHVYTNNYVLIETTHGLFYRKLRKHKETGNEYFDFNFERYVLKDISNVKKLNFDYER